MKGIGLCAIFSQQGDWAFDYALSLARNHKTRLNIFHFLESPYALRRDVVFVDAEKKKTAPVTPELITEKDKAMREMYDPLLGDYADVGFRLCEGNDEWELRKCFKRGEYEVLVIGYKAVGADFGGTTTIEEFASKFKGPVVLVGPDAADSYYINAHAKDMLEELQIADGKWKMIEA
ncbi:universal stress protein [Thermodesulfobacteriota bacterium]